MIIPLSNKKIVKTISEELFSGAVIIKGSLTICTRITIIMKLKVTNYSVLKNPTKKSLQLFL